MLCREKGYYSNVEVLEGIIRSRFSGTATCVGNPDLRLGDRSTVEVSKAEEEEDCQDCNCALLRSTSHSPWWCQPDVLATTDCLLERLLLRGGAVVLSVDRRSRIFPVATSRSSRRTSAVSARRTTK